MRKHAWKLLLALTPLFASEAGASQIAFVSQVKAVYPQGDGSFVLQFYTDSPSCTGTNAPNKYYFVAANSAGVNDLGAKNIYAAAMLAMAAGKQVIVVFDAATPSCYINRIEVDD